MPNIRHQEFSYQDRIKTAHQSGHLFAHIFESQLEEDGPEGGRYPLKNLFHVMAGKEGAWYDNHYQHNFPVNKKYGIAGLATTALKAEYPISLYAVNSNVGLLMDTAKPIIVHPGDGYTKADVMGMEVTADKGAAAAATYINFVTDEKLYPLFQSVFDAQALSPSAFPSIQMSENMTDRISRAEKGLQALWQRIGEIGWSADLAKRIGKGGMNEVNVAADLKDICGIIINKSDAKHLPYTESVRAAVELKAYLLEKYPESFDPSLPIISYELSRSLTEPVTKPKIIELDEKKIQAIINGVSSMQQKP